MTGHGARPASASRIFHTVITVAVVYLASVLVLAHLLAPREYSWIRKTVSSLAAQKYRRKALLQAGFIGFAVIFASSSFVDRPFRGAGVPAAAALYGFAACMALVGVFCTRPMEDVEYSRTEARLHNAFSLLAGVSFFVGILAFAWAADRRAEAAVHAGIAAAFVPLGLGFFVFQPVKGLFLRGLYAVGFSWLLLVDNRLL